MTGAPELPSPPRRGWIAALLLALGTGASLLLLTCPVYDPDFTTGDGAIYLLCARSLLEGDGIAYLGVPFSMRPPGLPVLLAPVLALCGEGARAIHLVVGATGVVACTGLFLLFRQRLGLALALALAVLLWLNPAFRLWSNQPMSDVPGLALLVLALLAERRASREPSVARELSTGVAIGLAAYVRAINLLVLPALILARLVDWRGELERSGSPRRFLLLRLALPALATAAVLLPWSLRNGQHPPEVPAELTKNHSYWTAMWHEDPGDPTSRKLSFEEHRERTYKRTRQVMHTLGSRLVSRTKEGAQAWFAWIALGGAAVALVRRRRVEDFLGGISLVVICTYFGFMERLLLPTFVLLLAGAADTLRWLATRFLGEARAGTAVAALVLGLGLWDFQSPAVECEARAAAEVAFTRVCERVAARFEPEEPLAARFGGHYAYRLHRDVWPLRWVYRRDGLEGALAMIEKHAVRGLILDGTLGQDRELIEYWETRGGQLVGRVGQTLILRLPE